MQSSSKNILITGVSTGIGHSLCKTFLERGYAVIGSIRNERDRDRLIADFGKDFHPILFDVRDEQAVNESVQEVKAIIGNSGLGGLINNAGVAISGPLADMSMEDVKYHFEVNVFGLLQVTKAYLPLLGAASGHSVLPGRIVNISSVAGKIASPFLGAYAASKYAVEALSDSLRRELNLYGIKVIVVGPGNVITPIWEKGVQLEKFRRSAFFPAFERFVNYALSEGAKGHSAEYLATSVADIFEKPNPAVRYAIVKDKFKNWTMPRLLSARTLDKMVSKMTGLEPGRVSKVPA
jgi:NAD(P)-dependent dehydrogenase (short-subunit alcohol dehydrogenase family)